MGELAKAAGDRREKMSDGSDEQRGGEARKILSRTPFAISISPLFVASAKGLLLLLLLLLVFIPPSSPGGEEEKREGQRLDKKVSRQRRGEREKKRSSQALKGKREGV